MFLWAYDGKGTYRWYLHRFIIEILYNSTASHHVQFYAAWENGMLEYIDDGVALLLQHSLGGNAFEQALATRAAISSVINSVTAHMSICADCPDILSLHIDEVLNMVGEKLADVPTSTVPALRSGKLHKWMVRACYQHQRA